MLYNYTSRYYLYRDRIKEVYLSQANMTFIPQPIKERTAFFLSRMCGKVRLWVLWPTSSELRNQLAFKTFRVWISKLACDNKTFIVPNNWSKVMVNVLSITFRFAATPMRITTLVACLWITVLEAGLVAGTAIVALTWFQLATSLHLGGAAALLRRTPSCKSDE